MKYKDIVNFTIINKLKSLLNNVCLTYNKIINPKNVKNRENEYYEVTTYGIDNDSNFIANNIRLDLDSSTFDIEINAE